ncbi:MAG TPA: sensor domain-containing diguanylate cyclase [Terriglobia bacterium]|nr:sensor domain-containing diguanylate cyclase [Terriglobia bacterium]
MKAAQSSAAERDTARLALLHEIGRALACARSAQEVLPVVAGKVHDFFQPVSLALLLLDRDSQELYAGLVVGSQAQGVRTRLKLGEGVAGWVAQHGEPLWIEDAGQDARCGGSFFAHSSEVRSVLCVPVNGRDSALGVIQLAAGPGGPGLSGVELPVLTVVADYVAIALENTRDTITDECTGLYNSRHLDHVLAREIDRSARFGHEFSIVFMDLDDFKSVNDTHGHLQGSKLLGMIGKLIQGQLRLSDSAFRYGGDEFVLLLPQTSKSNALVMVRRLREALSARVFPLGEERVSKVTAAYGVASFPGDATTAQDLLRVADAAMYRVKNTTRDGIPAAGGNASGQE